MSGSIDAPRFGELMRVPYEPGRSESRVVPGRAVLRPVPAAVETPPARRGEGPAQVGAAVARINDFVQEVQRDLRFSVDDATGRTVVKVIDSATEQVVRQIPADEILAIAENLEALQGVLFRGEA